MRIIDNLCEVTGIIIWLTKKVSRMLGNSYGITGLILATKRVSRISWVIKRITGFIG